MAKTIENPITNPKILMRQNFLASLFFFWLIALGAAQAAQPIIGVTKEELDGAGCVFYSQYLPATSRPVLIAYFKTAWMKINGEEITLNEVLESHNHRVSVYKSDDIKVILNLGKIPLPDSTYSNATITVIHRGEKSSIRLKGSCGC